MLVGGCFEGAPHSNPLDPRSEEFENAGAITGTVTTFYTPFDGLSSVEVRLSPGGLVTNTDTNGRFDFVGIEPGSYTLSAGLPGFAPASQEIEVVLNELEEVTFRLDGLPVIIDAQLQTFHLSRWWPPPADQFWLDIRVSVSDPDGVTDVESVFLEIPVVNLVDTLQAARDAGQFTVRLREDDIGVSVEAIAGHDVNITVRDRVGEESVQSGLRISRIIEETPVASTPTGLTEAATNPPVFTWQDEQVNYPFTFQVNIARVDDSIPTLVQTITEIPSDSLSVRASSPLATGQYSWTVSIVDEFGNQSRSREAGFFIP